MVRLITVIGHGIQLLPHFIDHYQDYVDEINIVVYESDLHPQLTDQVREVIDGNSHVKIIKTHKDRIFDWEKVTMLYNYITNKNPNDWWVIADIDEFHLYPNNDLKQVISNCEKNSWDIVRGGFIDRIGIGGEFSELTNNKTIWEQFPNAGFFRYPMSNACPNKICLIKGYVEITPGQHYAKINGQTTWRWQGWNHPLINPSDTVQVHHFKWDSTAIERIKKVSEVNKAYAFSSEYTEMIKALSKTKFKIDLIKNEYMFELGLVEPKYEKYKNWNNLINKIKSI
jgi:hypothetical protein